MLVLARQQNEEIIIGDTIRVVVLGIRPGVVRLGIDAPQGISVHRLEIQRKVEAQRNGQDHHAR
jgi:carbon storage regulator